MLNRMQNIFEQTSWDVLILFLVLGLIFLYALLNRRNHMLALIFSIYVSQLIFEHFHLLDPFLESEKASATNVFYFQAALYLIMIALIATLIYKKVFGEGSARFMFWKIAVMATLVTGLFANSFLRLLPVNDLRSEEHTSELQSPILISRMPSSA